MKRFLILLTSFLPLAASARGLDERIDEFVGYTTGWFVNIIFYQIPITDEVGLFWVLIPLILGALFFTIYFGVPGVRHIGKAINTVRGKYETVDELDADLNIADGDNPDTIRIEGKAVGEVTHFQALTAALSATVGLGNIAGVAVAVVIGGPGAIFWMILAGILGMSSKFVECTLGVKYREVDANGKVYGGPMYYLSKGLGERNMKVFGKVLAGLFAVMCIGGSFGGGNMFQSNQAASIFTRQLGIEADFAGAVFGIVLAVLVGIVIIGGIKRIANVTEKIVPFMALVYVLGALFILVANYDLIPQAVSEIVGRAFSPLAITGGFLGVLIQGFRRAAFSNEAGIGSAAIAHSAVKTRFPASEGLVALLEPFVDTVVVCTMTGLVIVTSFLKGRITLGDLNGAGTKYNEQAGGFPLGDGAGDGAAVIVDSGEVVSGVDLTTFVFQSSIPYFEYILVVAVILFAFSSMISWSYYGLQSWTYLFGRTRTQELIYKALFCVFVVLGAAASLDNVLNFSDAMIFAMMVPNMIGLLLLFPVVRRELRTYFEHIKAMMGRG